MFATLAYLPLPSPYAHDIIPKFRCATEISAFDKVEKSPQRLGSLISSTASDNRIFYKITGVGHWFTFTLSPPRFWRDGVEGSSTRENSVAFRTKTLRDVAFCSLCSTLHYWLYQSRTNCRDFNPSDLAYLPIPAGIAEGLPAFGPLAKRSWRAWSKPLVRVRARMRSAVPSCTRDSAPGLRSRSSTRLTPFLQTTTG